MLALLLAAALAGGPAPKVDVYDPPPVQSNTGYSNSYGYSTPNGSVRGGESYNRQTYQEQYGATYRYSDQPAYSPPPPNPDAPRAYVNEPVYQTDPR